MLGFFVSAAMVEQKEKPEIIAMVASVVFMFVVFPVGVGSSGESQ